MSTFSDVLNRVDFLELVEYIPHITIYLFVLFGVIG
jgi:hypothetical protein